MCVLRLCMCFMLLLATAFTSDSFFDCMNLCPRAQAKKTWFNRERVFHTNTTKGRKKKRIHSVFVSLCGCLWTPVWPSDYCPWFHLLIWCLAWQWSCVCLCEPCSCLTGCHTRCCCSYCFCCGHSHSYTHTFHFSSRDCVCIVAKRMSFCLRKTIWEIADIYILPSPIHIHHWLAEGLHLVSVRTYARNKTNHTGKFARACVRVFV